MKGTIICKFHNSGNGSFINYGKSVRLKLETDEKFGVLDLSNMALIVADFKRLFLLATVLCFVANTVTHGFSMPKRIIGGNTVRYGETPFLVSLQLLNASSRTSRHFCGASLLFDQFLLTAAHCVADLTDQLENVKAYLGTIRGRVTELSHENHTHTEDSDAYKLTAEETIAAILEGRQEQSEVDLLLNEKRQLSGMT